MELRKATTLREIFGYIRKLYLTSGETAVYLDNGWCVYAEDESLGLDSVCYADVYPDIDDDDNEIPSPFVTEHGLCLYATDENIQDTVTGCLHQKSNASEEEMLQALEYYMENDTFMVLNP